MRAVPLVLSLFALCALPASARAQEGGIEVFAGETLFAKGTRASISYIYRREGTLYDGSSTVSDPTDAVFEEHRAVLGIDHGFTADLTVSALVPYVRKDFDSNLGSTKSAGLGDIALLAKYRFYQKNWKRKAVNVAAIGGTETPTGRTDVTDDGVRLPPGLQPGLGSWNPFAALSLTSSFDRTRFDALAFYKFNNEGAQNFEKGDFAALGVTGAYRFLFEQYPGPSASAKLGLLYRHEDRAHLDGRLVTNSGFDQLLLRPGLSWHPKPGIDITLVIDVPIYQSYEGVQLGLDYRTFFAFGFRF